MEVLPFHNRSFGAEEDSLSRSTRLASRSNRSWSGAIGSASRVCVVAVTRDAALEWSAKSKIMQPVAYSGLLTCHQVSVQPGRATSYVMRSGVVDDSREVLGGVFWATSAGGLASDE